MIAVMGCKAQTIYPLEGPYGNSDDPKPWYMKDINHVRDSFVGVWKGSQNNKELTVYLYKLDGVANGLYGPMGQQFQDGIMGYYVYKENGITLINSKNRLLEPHVPNNQSYGPIFGFTFDGIDMPSMRFVDYGIPMQNTDGSNDFKGADADMTIINPNGNPLQLSFKLKNPVRGVMEGAYNLEFSIPTNMVLTKISNNPPPLD